MTMTSTADLVARLRESLTFVLPQDVGLETVACIRRVLVERAEAADALSALTSPVLGDPHVGVSAEAMPETFGIALPLTSLVEGLETTHGERELATRQNIGTHSAGFLARLLRDHATLTARLAAAKAELTERALGMKAWQDKWDHTETAREAAEAALRVARGWADSALNNEDNDDAVTLVRIRRDIDAALTKPTLAEAAKP